ncbi:DUF3052 domain-containing protein [Rhodospirillales bacterium TMPK1]|uniref:DUF3052 domain-containing protein n=1 Tax=Roseiterribacter gracilis TaxID=2812848 RepID=A0A8S8XGX4_9PROT|nr:DUF3052 domain-containing protein [Rhodospirillales bacterium TMPK1]
MTSGYSGTPLAKKLGYTPATNAKLIDAPNDYASWFTPRLDATFGGKKPFDLIHLFAPSRAALAKSLAVARKEITPAGMIWVSWYKKAAKIPTDVTEDTVRELAFPLDLVDVKVCAVNEVWSGLKLVIRKEKR